MNSSSDLGTVTNQVTLSSRALKGVCVQPHLSLNRTRFGRGVLTCYLDGYRVNRPSSLALGHKRPKTQSAQSECILEVISRIVDGRLTREDGLVAS